jgi:hypothetical protein
VAEIQSHYASLIAAVRGALAGPDAKALIQRLRDEETAVVRAVREKRNNAQGDSQRPSDPPEQTAVFPIQQQLG